MRRRLMRILSVAALAGTGALGIAVFNAVPETASTDSAFAGMLVANVVDSWSDTPRILASVPASVDDSAEAPTAVDDTITTRFDIPSSMRRQLSERELVEQLRDWLLFSIVDDQLADGGTLREVLFDLPVVRYGQMEAVATFEYGPVRARFLGGGKAIALVPAANDDRLARDYRAHAADMIRKDLGEPFEQLAVYEYTLDPTAESATLKHAPNVPYEELFSPAYGYHQGTVGSLAEFQDLLSAVDDITYVQRGDADLTLGGRKLLFASYSGLEVEHVATVWQSEQSIEAAKTDFDNWASNLLSEYNSRLNADPYLSKDTLQSEYDQLVVEEQIKRRLVDGSGFSLDPTYDFDGIAAALELFATVYWPNLASEDDSIVSALAVVLPQLCKDYSGLGEPMADILREDARSSGGELDSLSAEISESRQALGQREILPLLMLMDTLEKRSVPDRRSQLLRCLVQDRQVQFARYDGPLQGTEVGMILFYTDLLAKLWVIDYLDHAPEDVIPGFATDYNQPLQPIYLAESDALPYARLWFGPSDRGFAKGSDARTLFFARNSTRIYSAGSNPLRPGEEVETSRRMAASTDWWNHYYEEVAAYEQEYQRLNEIMKWSLVLGWLNEGGNSGIMGYLADVPVRRDLWFSDWALENTQLRYVDWTGITFFPRGYLGTETEALPQLSSVGTDPFDPSKSAGIIGGVSLAPKRLFQGRLAPAASNVAAPARRSFMNGGDFRALNTFEGRAFDFVDDGLSVLAKPVSVARRRGIGLELSNQPVRRTFEAEVGGSRIEVAFADTELGVLSKAAVEPNGFAVGFEGRLLDRTYEAVRRISASDDVALALQTDPNIVAVLRAGDSHFVKLSRSDKWVEIAPDAADNITVAEGWLGRAAEFGSSRPLQFRYVTDSELATSLADRTIVLQARSSGAGVDAALASGDAAITGRNLELAFGETIVPVRVDGGAVSLRLADLPASWRNRPENVLKLIDDTDLARIVGSDAQRVAISDQAVAAGDDVAQALAQGDAAALARAVPRDPVAARVVLDQEYQAGVSRFHAFLESGDPHSALAEIKALEQVFGNTPDLALRRALARLDQSRPADAVSALSVDSAGQMKFGDTLFEEIVARTKIPGASGRDYEQLLKLAQYERIRTPGSAGPVMRPYLAEDGMALRLQFTDLSKATKASPDEIAQALRRGDEIYVERSPSFADLDWSAGLDRVIAKTVDGHLGEVVRLPAGDATAFRPSQIYSKATEQVFEAAPKRRTGDLLSDGLDLGVDLLQELPSDECSTDPASCQNQPNTESSEFVYLLRAA